MLHTIGQRRNHHTDEHMARLMRAALLDATCCWQMSPTSRKQALANAA